MSDSPLTPAPIMAQVPAAADAETTSAAAHAQRKASAAMVDDPTEYTQTKFGRKRRRWWLIDVPAAIYRWARGRR